MQAVWVESEAGIGELLRCGSPNLSGGSLKEPQRVNARWWASNGITISQEPMGREDLFVMAAAARASGTDEDLVNLFWHTLAWRVVGNFRNAAQIVRASSLAGSSARLCMALRPAAEASYGGDLDAAYRAFVDHPISRFNYAFFSKFLYFTSDRSSNHARCLILDDRVATALAVITGESYIPAGKRRSTAYVKYCNDMHRWAVQYGVDPDDIEWRLYRFGQLINYRGNWLSTEVSLYRDGLTPVSFDAIVERVGIRRSRGL